MSQTGVVSWSQTAATNATADSNVNWAEGMAPSQVNDSARAEMASVAKYRDDTAGTLATGGTSGAYTVTSNQSFSSLSVLHGQELNIRFSTTNSSGATLSVDGLSAAPIYIDSSFQVPLGAIRTNGIYRLTYDNTIPGFVLNNVPNALNLTSPAAATSPLNGALNVTGGAGIQGDLFVGGTANGIILANSQNTNSLVQIANSSTGTSAGCLFEGNLNGVSNAFITYGVISNGNNPTGILNTGSAVTSIQWQMNGTSIGIMTKGGGWQFGNPTGGDEGAGTLNVATNVFTNGTPHKKLLNTLTANNSANLSDTTSLTSAYTVYELDFVGLTPNANNDQFLLQVHSGGGFQTGTYNSGLGSTTHIGLSAAAVANSATGLQGTLKVYGTSNTTFNKMWTGVLSYATGAGGITGNTVAGYWESNAAVDGFQVSCLSSNIGTGKILVWGVG